MEGDKARRRLLQGKVVSIAGDKSPVVLVERRVVHPKYRKIVRRFKKYIIHDPDAKSKVGDMVVAVECPPVSKRKSFMLRDIVSVGVSE